MTDKIKELLKKANVKEDLIDGICNALVEAKERQNAQLQTEFAEKIERAKKVCIDEANAYKKDLARRLQIWCEATSAKVERKVAQQAAIKETEAVSKLEQIRHLTEGVELNGATNSTLKSEVNKLRTSLKSLTEENKRLNAKATRQTTLAESALRRNRLLEGKLAGNKPTITETTAKPGARRFGTRRLDESRTASQPVTTRRTIIESQSRVPERVASPTAVFGPAEIAADMD